MASQPTLAAPDPTADAAITDALAGIATAGSFFTGAERIALAEQARFARGLTESGPRSSRSSPNRSTG